MMSLYGCGARALARRVQLKGAQMGAIALAFEWVSRRRFPKHGNF
jgi:hypothetical protein